MAFCHSRRVLLGILYFYTPSVFFWGATCRDEDSDCLLLSDLSEGIEIGWMFRNALMLNLIYHTFAVSPS